MAIVLTVTDAGRAALINAAHTGTAAVTIAQVGVSGAAVTPGADMTALPGETKRIATISGDVVAADTIHLIVRDESTSVFTVRSFALYLADGTLFALYGQSDVILEKSSQAMMLLAIDVQFADIDAAQLTFGDTNFLNPPATTERQGVVELATLAEAIAGLDTSRVPAAKMVKDAVTAWLDARFGANNVSIWHPGNDGSGSGLDADLLDGYHASVFGQLGGSQTWSGPNTFTGTATFGPAPVANGGIQLGAANGPAIFADTGKAILRAGSTGAYSYLNLSTTGLDFNGYKVWHSANDGSGSGLDADYVRGCTIGTSGAAIPLLNGINFWSGMQYFPNNIATEFMYFPSTGAAQCIIYRSDTGAITISTNRQAAGSEKYFTFGADGQLRGGGVIFWNASNDGAGSGLDADLLDGLHAASFARVDAAAGVTFAGGITAPYLRSTNTANVDGMLYAGGITIQTGDVFIARTNTAWGYVIRPNIAGYRNLQFACEGGVTLDNVEINAYNITTLGNRVWNSGNDGSGSGLDADLLDGYDWSFFANIPARLGFTPVQQGTGVSQLSNVVKIGWAGTRLKCTVDSTDQGNFVFDNQLSNPVLQHNGSGMYRNSLSLWGPDNDGSGSGLDADLLDGQHASAFKEYLFAPGDLRLPGGMILKFGWVAALTNRAQNVITFPVAFPNECTRMWATQGKNLVLTDVQTSVGAEPISTSQGIISVASQSAGTIGASWWAIGY